MVGDTTALGKRLRWVEATYTRLGRASDAARVRALRKE
jgi:hypothetical protein